MIPKVAHFFWSGETMSLMRYLTLASFRQNNPDWEMVLHSPSRPCIGKTWQTPEQQDFCSSVPVRENWIDAVESLGVRREEWNMPRDELTPVHASDLFCWDILATAGGLYCDMDILFVNPLGCGITEDKLAYDAWLCFYANVFPIGMLAGRPGNPFFADVFSTALHRVNEGYQSLGCEAGTATIHNLPTFLYCGESRLPAARLHAVRSHYQQRILSFPPEIVYPWFSHQLSNVFMGKHRVKNETVGIHWYGGHPLAQQMNRELTSDTLGRYDNTFTHYARQVKLP